MAHEKRRILRRPEPEVSIGSTAARLLRALMPAITLRLILRALIGVVLFFCGLVFGIWPIIRFRRRVPE